MAHGRHSNSYYGFHSLEISFQGDIIDVKYEMPTRPGVANGLIFLAHGCSHSAGDFWPRSPSCPDCLGLPEEIRIREAALRRGYAVVAISSMDRKSRCWREIDLDRVAHALGFLYRNLTLLQGLPLYGLGASSGGMFVLMLASSQPEPRFTAICSQIMALFPEDEMEYRIEHSAGRYPPTLFVHMPRDKMTARAVKESIAVLNKHKIPVKEIQVHPSPLTPSYLSETTDELPMEQSKAIFKAFKESKIIDERGFLIHDPRASDWRQVLKPLPFHDSLRLEPDASPISEELNVLWAGHEIIASTTDETIDWFEQQYKRA